MESTRFAVFAEGLQKRYGKVKALDGLDLQIPGGKVCGLLGPNGAGKTTAVRILSTLLRPDGGRAEVAGFDVVRQAGQVRYSIGLAGQQAAVDEILTGRQNLETFGRLYHLGAREARSRADDLLQRFGLAEAAGKQAKNYSGGMRRRLDLAASFTSTSGGGDYREFLMPGMFVMTMAFGLEATMMSIAADAAKGVTDRFRSMPMAPSAVVLGRSIADMLNSILGLSVMVACGLVVGWRWHGSVGESLLAVGLLLLLRFSLLWVGIYLGLVAKSPEAVAAVQILVWPVLFLSNTFVAPETMPGWLGAISEWNPLSATVAATRELFGNPVWGGETWAVRNAPLMAVLWPMVIFAVFFPLSVRRYRRLSR